MNNAQEIGKYGQFWGQVFHAHHDCTQRMPIFKFTLLYSALELDGSNFLLELEKLCVMITRPKTGEKYFGNKYFGYALL